MDCNWCAVCSKHFHCENQTSLYCSDACRKEDALACCAFHDCDHPDGSAHHDHLTFCHHHRPAIRIPAMMPLLNLNPNPSTEQQAHGQHQTDEWMRFLQQQYSSPHHALPAHTSMIRPTMSTGGTGAAAGPGSATSAGVGRGQLAMGQGQNQPPHHHHILQGSTFHGYHSHTHYHHHPCSAPVQHHSSSFLLSSELPVTSCQELQQQAQFLRQQKPAASQFHQRHSSQSSISQGVATSTSPTSVCSGGEECAPHFLKSVFLHSSVPSLSPSSPPFIPFHAKRSLSIEGERGAAPAAEAVIQGRMRQITPCEANDCEQPCVVRKNKVLPPPTLSPLLPVTISNPASLSPTSPIGVTPVANLSSASSSPSSSSSSSGYSDEEDSDDALSHAWPKMDQLFFPDHCCRTSACGGPPRQPSSSGGRNNKNGRKNNKTFNGNKGNKKEFISELPPPPNHQRFDGKDGDGDGGCMALSASIWGAGWHQVEPLPASFVKTLKSSNMLWAGCEKEYYNHQHGAKRQHQQNRGRRDFSHCNGGNGGGRRASKKDQSNDASSWSTVCSSRLPRSLQFID